MRLFKMLLLSSFLVNNGETLALRLILLYFAEPFNKVFSLYALSGALVPSFRVNLNMSVRLVFTTPLLPLVFFRTTPKLCLPLITLKKLNCDQLIVSL